jgi:hypothetical protein
VDVKPFAAVSLAAALLALGVASSAWAGQLGTDVPSVCTPHTSFSGGADVAGDYRCAGLAIQFHTAGSAASPFPIWAGQWLFRDESGQYRVGTCTFNRGVHPTTAVRSRPVAQSFPNDPSGLKGAYLAWRYGDTRDPLTAAAVWAVFHYYALDAAGSNRSTDGSAPLVSRLDGIAAASGRADLQSMAVQIDGEAAAMSGPWHLGVSLDSLADDSGVVTATLSAGDTPVPDREVTVLVSGIDIPFAATTGTDGTATVTVPLPPGAVTVAATTETPGPVLAYRGSPASPDGDGAQTLVTGGPPTLLRADTVRQAPEAPTEVPVTDVPVTEVPVTDVPVTETPTTILDTTILDTTTLVVETPTTASPTTAPTPTAPTTSAPIALVPVPSTVAPHPPLPRTGTSGGGGVAWLATAFLVGGIGLLGTLRRRDHTA